jgi:AcrR family transcriptional regulator
MTIIRSGLAGGRSRQKLRTRKALLDAARQLVAEGCSPTVEDAAAAADISRTTAYRYFRNQAELLGALHPELEARSLLPDDAPDDPAQRLDMVVKVLLRTVLAGEAQYRTMLRLSLEEPRREEPLFLRQGRAIAWIEDALSPLRKKVPRAKLRRLVLAVRAAVGIEALVWLADVAKLSREEAARNMRWSAQALLHATLAGL